MEKLKIFAKTIEQEAYEQVCGIANSDAYNDCTIRIMPDCHAGKGCTVGTVIQIKDKIVPNTVGVDIGCGMLVAELGKIDIDLSVLDNVINTYVPNGSMSHFKNVMFFDKIKELYCFNQINTTNAELQIGTLGGGNHFIEVNVDKDDNKYLVIHSGSRHLGVEVCKFYQKLANKSLNNKRELIAQVIDKLKSEGREREIEEELKKIQFNNCDKEYAYLSDADYEMYLHDMQIVQEYASLNRRSIACIILNKMNIVVGEYFETIHNYIDVNSNILRKGAVSAKLGEKIIIPMNMRDGSLICIGKGNADWLNSAPHGAGRLMSRTKAKEVLSMEKYEKEMNGIYTSSVCDATIDEAPMAYKSIEEIIECIEPTAFILMQIKPIYNFKSKNIDYQKAYDLVKSKISRTSIPKTSWVWEYLRTFDTFMLEVLCDKSLRRCNNCENLAENIYFQLVEKFLYKSI